MLGIGDVKATTVVSLEVCEIVDRIHHVVDRHEIVQARLDPDQRHPFRQGVADALQHLERIVGAIDLVDLAGARVTDYRAGAIDPVRDAALLAHHLFGVVLGAEVRVIEILGFLEHVLAETAAVETAHRYRADVVKAAGAERLGRAHRVQCAVDVGEALALLAGAHVVDRGEVEEMIDAALELRDIGGGDAETVGGDVAADADDALGRHRETCFQFIELVTGGVPHQQMDGAATGQQVFDKETADKAGAAGQEIVHGRSSLLIVVGVSIGTAMIAYRKSTVIRSRSFGFSASVRFR